MKFLKTFSLAILFAALIAGSISCTRDVPALANPATIESAATVQVFSATVKASRNYIYVDGVPVTGSALALGSIFPSSTYAFKVDAGTHTFLIKDTLPATTQTPLTFQQTLEAGKNYTIFTYDTITSVKQTTVLNNIVIPTDTSCRLRFANFIYNKTPLPAVDVLSSAKGNTAIFTNVATNTVTDFIPYPSGIRDTLSIYATGTTTPLLVRQILTGQTPTRSYTTIYSGSYSGTKTFTVFSTY